MKDPKYFADEICSEFECTMCGFEFHFDGSVTFEQIRKQLEAHICYPTALKLARPQANATIH